MRAERATLRGGPKAQARLLGLNLQCCSYHQSLQQPLGAGPSLESDIIGFLRKGVSLRELSRHGAWIEIDYRGQAGWIGSAYVNASGNCG